MSIASETYDLCRDLSNRRAAICNDHGEGIKDICPPTEPARFSDSGIRCSPKHSLAETAPFLGKMFLPDVSEAMKIFVYNSGYNKLSDNGIPEFTDIREKVISNRMFGTTYNVSEYRDLDSDGFPAKMTANEKIIAKKFLNRCLTNEELAVFNYMVVGAYNSLIYFNHLQYFAQKAHWTNQSAEFWKEVREARKSDWFIMPEPTAEEIKYCGEWI